MPSLASLSILAEHIVMHGAYIYTLLFVVASPTTQIPSWLSVSSNPRGESTFPEPHFCLTTQSSLSLEQMSTIPSLRNRSVTSTSNTPTERNQTSCWSHNHPSLQTILWLGSAAHGPHILADTSSQNWPLWKRDLTLLVLCLAGATGECCRCYISHFFNTPPSQHRRPRSCPYRRGSCQRIQYKLHRGLQVVGMAILGLWYCRPRRVRHLSHLGEAPSVFCVDLASLRGRIVERVGKFSRLISRC